VYYFELTDFKVEYPTWVKQGERFHNIEEKLWQRRNLSRFNLQNGKVHHNLVMQNDELGLHGIADMVIRSPSAAPASMSISATTGYDDQTKSRPKAAFVPHQRGQTCEAEVRSKCFWMITMH